MFDAVRDAEKLVYKPSADYNLPPLSQHDYDVYSNPLNPLRSTYRPSKRPVPNPTNLNSNNKKFKANQYQVTQYYNDRPDYGKDLRKMSPIFNLKNFNNWIKAVLIASFARFEHPPLARVLDIGCGKGGDLNKWTKSNIIDYVGLDIAQVSINQAQARYNDMRKKSFNTHFNTLDCFKEPLDKAIPKDSLDKQFNAVSCQFAMHYAFDSEESVRCLLENVTKHLKPGGSFIGTIIDASVLIEALGNIDSDDNMEFGNSLFRIKFDQRPDENNFYGQKYNFHLEDAVDAPEYLIQWDIFTELARSYGLELLAYKPFQEIFYEQIHVTEFQRLASHLKIIDDYGTPILSDDEWGTVGIYVAFAFKKVDN
ncbi:hypothetical protein E3P92_03729 [Wallemia ichthyophaga]|uniref:mRNA cap guanine-N(7) methyltransferase n=1 Tax=Wallemia ichthyophaga TaxID=245174 RepID=A0A4T0G7J7_WALIC|nr:hypothetical protein E3P91_04041 [Wallemia ichthyophaga]TIA78084.1 hypothetical protein E3P98_03985 [Wallemia ichthyophaga]TIA95492.1 hypothetical protein E3P95_03677 [Wallemia ichthyophaga]TIA96444.1 hypothetical protein E3P94_03686 [Wallemia ichthyophaga]TIB01946.1 hypothetical protein E3P96_02259 [Wallemia ichthyophaga]